MKRSAISTQRTEQFHSMLAKAMICAGVFGLALISMTACGGSGGPGGSAESQIKARTEEIFEAVADEDWDKLNSVISPESGCNEALVESVFSYVNLAIDDPSKQGVRDIEVSVDEDGRSATTTYVATYDGEDLEPGNDTWERIDGDWYVEFPC